MTSKSIFICCQVICLLAVMYLTGRWVGQQINGGDLGNELSLNAEELSMLTKNEFLEVSRILNDPKTTNFPLPANYNQDSKYQGIQSETERMPLMVPSTPSKNDIILPNDFVHKEATSVKPLKTKDIFVNRWVRDLSTSKICQANQKLEPLTLFVVVSAPSHFKERAAIREGWGKTAAKGNITSFISLNNFILLSK